MEESEQDNEKIPVTFSVNMKEQNLEPNDKIYLNGSFNNWCGTCNPMNESDKVWSLSIDLYPGKYEYLFTINNWEQTGNAPLGSICDFSPCDEYANYGLVVSSGINEIITDTYCWKKCTDCETTGLSQETLVNEKKLMKIYDLMGREVDFQKAKILLYYFDDGSVEKCMNFGEENFEGIH